MAKLDQLISTFIEGDKDYQWDYQKNLSHYSTIKVPSSAPLLEVKSVSALKKVLPYLNENNIVYKMLGWGANQVIKNTESFIYLKLNFAFDRSALREGLYSYRLPASVSLAVLTSFASRHGIADWQVFTGIPASLGGAIYMNAGTSLGEMKDVVSRVWYLDIQGNEQIHEVSEESFSYRQNNFLKNGEVIIEAELKVCQYSEDIKQVIKDYLKMRNRTQPLNEKTCGCMFKNHISDSKTCRAGHYIDIMGLKGLIYGGAQVGHKHANFLINRRSASYDDVKNLVEFVQSELYLHYGIKFEVEFEY